MNTDNFQGLIIFTILVIFGSVVGKSIEVYFVKRSLDLKGWEKIIDLGKEGTYFTINFLFRYLSGISVDKVGKKNDPGSWESVRN